MASIFRDPWVLRRQIHDVVGFHYPECIDHVYGGYRVNRDEGDGHVYDGSSKHLVGSARLTYNFAVGARIGGPDWCRSAAAHGLAFLFDGHYDAEREGFDWLLEGRETVDATRYCYGHAFCLLACAAAVEIDLPGATDRLERVAEVIDERFFEPEYGLCRAEADGDWNVSSYRGQNANMHACEAFLAAYEATDSREYLDRAYTIAASLVDDRSDEDGRIWEHYTADWKPDFAYNREKPRDLFRPWGYQPGHHLEWAKLLCLLARHREDAWLTERARELFEWAVEAGWDDAHGGFYYTLDRDDEPVVAEKYGWPVAEGIGAAALLAGDDGGDGDGETGDGATYLEWYDRCWTYAREHLLNPKYGTWYGKLTPQGERIEPEEKPRVEPGYHPLTNAFVAMETFEG